MRRRRLGRCALIAVLAMVAARSAQPSTTGCDVRAPGSPDADRTLVAPSPDSTVIVAAAVAAGGSDSCFMPATIIGVGTFPFDTTNATTDGLEHPACFTQGTAQIENDVWFAWISDCTGTITLQTCGQSTVDTRLAVYAETALCQPDDGPLLACSDDACGFQSSVTFNAIAGDSYLIRIGTFPGSPTGAGTFTLAGDLCGPGPPPLTGADACEAAQPITGVGLFDFDTSLAGMDGDDDPVCGEYGAVAIDNDVWFLWTSTCDELVTVATCEQTIVDTRIAVYGGGDCPTGSGILGCSDDACGFQSLVTFDAEPGATYLIRIGTFPEAPGGPGRFRISGAACGGGPPEQSGFGGDECAAGPDVIVGEGVFLFSNGTATTDGPEHPECIGGVNGAIEKDVWFTWAAPCDGSAMLSTCGGTTLDTRIAVYAGLSCPAAGVTPIICSDDACGPQSQVVFDVAFGAEYLFRVGSAPGTVGGIGTMVLQCSDEPTTCNCCQASGVPGCNDVTCQAIVCAVDAFCCAAQWDTLCATQATNLCACCTSCENCDAGCQPADPPASCDRFAPDCQAADQAGHGGGGTVGVTSDTGPVAGYVAADNVRVTESGFIESVCWWGFYVDFGLLAGCSLGEAGGVFTITYYDDDHGQPGQLRAGPFDVGGAGGSCTGNTIATGIGPIDEHVYTASHDPVAVTSGECLWIEIRNQTAGPCVWLWSTAPDGDGASIQSGEALDFDLAFCIDQPITADGCAASEACLDSLGQCCVASPFVGCRDPECCSAVCAVDVFCCQMQWDESCAVLAMTLCPVTCPPDTTPPIVSCSATGVTLDAASSESHDDGRVLQLDWIAEDDGISVTTTGHLHIDCDSIELAAGTTVEIDCLGDGCNWWFDRAGILHVTSSTVTLSVVAEDAAGNVATCAINLCGAAPADPPGQPDAGSPRRARR